MEQEKALLYAETKEEVEQALREQPALFHRYQSMEKNWRQRFIDYCTRKKTLPITYDPFFKRLFHPEVHPGRLSRFLSSLLGQKVKVKCILPGETILDGGALLIMDILVELEDGSLANVEVQKIPYLFPGERMSCYSSDMVLRQYSRVKGEKGNAFNYSDMKKVYTIVIFETSAREFHREGLGYIHMGRTLFDTGLELELLQEYCLIALDVFRKIPYPKDRSERTGWLSLLAVEDVAQAEALQEEFPWLKEIYRDMAEYMIRPGEVLNMFSEALKILDQNTVQFMIEEQEKKLAEQLRELEEQQEALEESQKTLEESQKALEESQKALEENQKALEEQRQELEEKDRKLVQKDEELVQKGEELVRKDEELKEQSVENQRLRAEVERLKKQLEKTGA